MRRCATKHCRNWARSQRTMCNTCRARSYDDPLKKLFWNLRASARRRNLNFSLTWLDFEELAISSGYDRGRGKTGQSLTVDRIDPWSGDDYAPWNVRVITRAENARKRWADANNYVARIRGVAA